MNIIHRILPIFVSTNLEATEVFYSTVLGFRTDGKHDDYLIMVQGAMQIHFSKVTHLDQSLNYCACYIGVADLDTLYEKCLAAKCVHPNGQLQTLPWGREFSIIDPDYNLIKVAAN